MIYKKENSRHKWNQSVGDSASSASVRHIKCHSSKSTMDNVNHHTLPSAGECCCCTGTGKLFACSAHLSFCLRCSVQSSGHLNRKWFTVQKTRRRMQDFYLAWVCRFPCLLCLQLQSPQAFEDAPPCHNSVHSPNSDEILLQVPNGTVQAVLCPAK